MCHSIIINLEINGNHEKYASETMLKQFLVKKIESLNYTFDLLIESD